MIQRLVWNGLRRFVVSRIVWIAALVYAVGSCAWHRDEVEIALGRLASFRVGPPPGAKRKATPAEVERAQANWRARKLEE
jgi:hypothetical protein